VISLRNLTKRYGGVVAVDQLSVDVLPGRVTGFLGPNGAGKSTTMRMIVGLDRPTSGTAHVGGSPYASLRWPLREVGALLDARAVHPGRSARDHLRSLALSNRIPRARADEVLDMVGLASVATKRAGTFSLGMNQRLGIATALLGDPPILLFDEPVNGLDAEGVHWVRSLIRDLAAEGRTVLVSSHLMSEMQDTADQVVIIGRGRLIADAPLDEIIRGGTQHRATVRTSQAEALAGELRARALVADRVGPDELAVTGGSLHQIGEVAHELSIPVHELSRTRTTLEQAYLELTARSVEHRASTSPTQAATNREDDR
jgi:ABC-2 type transport system ATP-binding protein